MILLKINNKKGEFYDFDSKNYKDVTDIEVKNLKEIIEYILDSSEQINEIIYDEKDLESKESPNVILFKELVNNINSVIKNRSILIDEIDKDMKKLKENLNQ